MNNGELTDKQRCFAEEYVQCLNATKAAKRADYSEATAYSIGYENLRKPAVRQRIRDLMQERSLRTRISSDLILQQLAEIAQGGDGLKGADRIKALEMLAKHLGFYEEKPARGWPATFLVEDKLKALVQSMPVQLRLLLLCMEKWQCQKVVDWLTENYHTRMETKIAEAVAQGRTVVRDKDGKECHYLVNTERHNAYGVVEDEASYLENELFAELVGEAMKAVLPESDMLKIMQTLKRKQDSKLP